MPLSGQDVEVVREITIRNLTQSNVIGTHIEVADTSLSRVIGLLGKSGIDAGAGMLINPSSGVHTIGMRFPIDVVGLDDELRVVRLWPRLVPYRLTAISLKVRTVLELAAGEIAATHLSLGDHLEVDGAINSAATY
jgi:uncharacterized membrane protein (UPF0127 family)